MQSISDTKTKKQGARQPASKRIAVLLLLGLALAVAAVIVPHAPTALGLTASSVGIFTAAVFVFLRANHAARQQARAFEAVKLFIEKDAAPGIITRGDGRVISQNAAARRQFNAADSVTLAAVLRCQFANPGAILYRLQSRAETSGAAQEDIVTRSGHIRLSVHEMTADGYVWRIEQIADRAMPRSPGDGLPMLMVGRGDTILFMNDAARQLIGARAKSLDRVFTALPVVAGIPVEISTADGPQMMIVADVPAGAGRRALYLVPAPDGQEVGQDWQVFQDLPVPMIKVAPDGAVLGFNRMAAQLMGMTLAKGAALSNLMEGLGRSISDWLEDTLAGRGAQRSEFLRLTRTDREVFVQVTLNRITDAGVPGLIAVLHDATELKSLEAQFVQSQKMQAIGQLAGGVAHDFNNLLTAISGHCDLLLLRHDQGDPDYADLVQVNQNANRAAALVGQLLAFSRKQTLRPETVDMRDTLADLTHLLNRLVGEKVTLTLSHDPVLKPIRADKRQLEQVLMNLVVNARDAMPAGGEIRIITECVTLNEPLLRDRVSVPVGEYVTVTVSDDGIGIPPDKLQKVFEPFFTTKRTGEGTGLGLSTAYGIVKQTGGFIFADSIEGTGTEFTLYFQVLGLQPPQASPEAKSPTQNVANTGDGVVLLVEDEAPVRAFASRALRLRGYTVLEAESAEAALKTLEDETLNINVFVTDVVMPGMDGPSWVRQALKNRPEVKVVFVSGYAEDSFGEEQTKIPNSVFLPKPFSLTDLTDTVQRQLN